MKILLDECVPRPLANHLPSHTVSTVPQAGWASVKNGALLKLAGPQFDVFITVDRNMSFQQNFDGLQITVVVIGAPTNKLKDILPVVPKLQELLSSPLAKDVYFIRA